MRASGQAIDPEPLPETVRQHLGRALALAYGLEPEPDRSSRFGDLLTRLEGLLDAQDHRDEQTFREALLAAAPMLLNFAMSLTRDRAQADDLTQDTMLRAWRSRTSFVRGTNIEAWLFTIMRNAFYSRVRRHGREVQDSDGSYAERLSCAPEQSASIDLQDVLQALDSLPATMREALLHLTLHHMTYEEVAQVMGCEIGTVKSRVWRARNMLAKRLGYSARDLGSDAVSLAVLGGTHTLA